SIICSPMTSLKTSIKTITYLSDTGCLEIQGASLVFILETQLCSVLEGLQYLSSENAVYKQHDKDGWFCEQGELPF
ncbi:hypothetical protein NEN86_25700, partial [Escherichia coli]|nr:hypothetical protein [Escherichia coli]